MARSEEVGRAYRTAARTVNRLNLFEPFVLPYFDLPRVADIDAALSTPFEEDAGLRNGGDFASGAAADERRTTNDRAGSQRGRERKKAGEEVADTPISTRLCPRHEEYAGLRYGDSECGDEAEFRLKSPGVRNTDGEARRRPSFQMADAFTQ